MFALPHRLQKKGYLYWATELVRGKNQAAKGDGVTSTNIKCPAAPAGGCAEDGKILGGFRGTVRVATNYSIVGFPCSILSGC